MAVASNLSGGEDGGLAYRPLAEINVTPLVDVMLVLLIIFMVAAPLMVQGVPINLPKTSAAKLSPPKKPMVVSLARDGSLYVRDEKLDLASLGTRLAAWRADQGDTIVYVRADRGLPYGQVMDILGRIGASGYARVSLLAEPASGAGVTAR